MKRFYSLVTTSKAADGYEIHLDGKPVKTPSKAHLKAPNEALAHLVMQEWAEQGETIEPANMPLTQFLTTRIDRVSAERKAMRDAVLKYFDTDLVCYRTDQPEELGKRQARHWDVWLGWFKDHFGYELKTTTSLFAVKHDPKAHQALADYVDGLDDDHFTVLQILTASAGSIILPVAFMEGCITAEQLFEACRVEETYKGEIYNEEKHGPDPMQEKRDTDFKKDLAAAEQYLNCLRPAS